MFLSNKNASFLLETIVKSHVIIFSELNFYSGLNLLVVNHIFIRLRKDSSRQAVLQGEMLRYRFPPASFPALHDITCSMPLYAHALYFNSQVPPERKPGPCHVHDTPFSLKSFFRYSGAKTCTPLYAPIAINRADTADRKAYRGLELQGDSWLSGLTGRQRWSWCWKRRTGRT